MAGSQDRTEVAQAKYPIPIGSHGEVQDLQLCIPFYRVRQKRYYSHRSFQAFLFSVYLFRNPSTMAPTMRCLRFHARGDIRLDDIPIPPVGDSDVKVNSDRRFARDIYLSDGKIDQIGILWHLWKRFVEALFPRLLSVLMSTLRSTRMARRSCSLPRNTKSPHGRMSPYCSRP